MLNKHINNYPEGAPEELVREYRETLIRLTDQTGAVPTGPEVFYEVKALKKRLAGFLGNKGEMRYVFGGEEIRLRIDEDGDGFTRL